MRSRRPSSRWIIVAIAGSALEADALRNSRRDATLSYAVREIFQTRTPLGKATFVIAWVAFSAWWIQHIVGGENP